MENEQPEITIISPSANHFYQVLDTIPIDVQVSDDVLVTSVEIKLVNEAFIGVDASIVLPINQQEKTINTAYIPQNIDLTSGVYYIEVKASDGALTNREYVPVNIGEFPLVWEGVLIASINGEISRWLPGSNATTLWNLPFQFSEGTVNNRLGHLICGNSMTGDIFSFGLNEGSVQWQQLWNGISSDHFFREIAYDTNNKIILASDEQHRMKKYSPNGTDIGMIDVGVNFEVDQIVANEDFIFLETASPTQSLHEFRTYFVQTNSLVYTDVFNGDIIDLQILSDNEVVILSNNSDGVGEVYVYNILNQTYNFYSLFIDEARAMEVVDGGKIVVSTEGSFYQFDFSSNQLVLIASDFSPTYLAYDVVNNQLIAGTENIVRSYGVIGWQVIDELILSNEIGGVFNLYNK